MTLRSIITKTGRYVFTQRHTRTKLTRAEQLNLRMSQEMNENKNKVYKVVLSGGPCGGKTTGQARLSTFFENLGWKVYRAQETALVLMSGGVKFSELSKNDAYKFQENLIKTMIQIENTYMDLASTCKKNCLIICDRGVMDGSAYLPTEDWEKMKKDNDWNEVNLRDNRYDQIIHMVTAANGAEAFYTCAGHKTRTEGIEEAVALDKITAQKDNDWNEVNLRDNRYDQIIHMVTAAIGAEAFYTCAGHKTRTEGIEEAVALDKITAQAWVGHPYFDVIDNSTDFEEKIMRMVGSVCNRLGIDAGDRLHSASKKRKFLVSCLPDNEKFPTYQDFTVVHDYLVTPSRKMQARLRKRGQNGVWTYTHTIRRPEINNQSVEVKMPINFKDYQILLVQKDDNNATIYKQRRCFLWGDRHYQMDIYTDQCPEKCAGLVLLETYTTSSGELVLPDFLDIKKEVTSDPEYSMFNLSRKDTLSKNSPVKGGGKPNGNTQGLINDGLPQTNGNGIVGH